MLILAKEKCSAKRRVNVCTTAKSTGKIVALELDPTVRLTRGSSSSIPAYWGLSAFVGAR
jgi:hypothetical protein